MFWLVTRLKSISVWHLYCTINPFTPSSHPLSFSYGPLIVILCTNVLVKYRTPLIPAAYGGRYRSTFAFLLLHVFYVHIFVSMRYTDSCSFIYIDVTGYSMYTFFCYDTTYYVFLTYHLSLW